MVVLPQLSEWRVVGIQQDWLPGSMKSCTKDKSFSAQVL